ncbi:hypothetical protein [Arthrobacter sp. MW3 TE3886]|uniref:hypothetical protein n=1 Tax=Arthrobacter sp. MW3 TE3886 TaxID=3156254 RepID=UPI003516805D
MPSPLTVNTLVPAPARVNEPATVAALVVILALALTIDLLWKRTRSRRVSTIDT